MSSACIYELQLCNLHGKPDLASRVCRIYLDIHIYSILLMLSDVIIQVTLNGFLNMNIPYETTEFPIAVSSHTSVLFTGTKMEWKQL